MDSVIVQSAEEAFIVVDVRSVIIKMKLIHIDKRKNAIYRCYVDGEFDIIVNKGEISIFPKTKSFSFLDKPEFKHDCDECIFLYSTWDEKYKHYDMYFCPNELTVLGRYGDQPSDYISGLELKYDFIKNAKEYAIKIGLLG